MRLKTKLLLAQVPLALALLVLGIIAITTIGQLGLSSEKILKQAVDRRAAISCGQSPRV